MNNFVYTVGKEYKFPHYNFEEYGERRKYEGFVAPTYDGEKLVFDFKKQLNRISDMIRAKKKERPSCNAKQQEELELLKIRYLRVLVQRDFHYYMKTGEFKAQHFFPPRLICYFPYGLNYFMAPGVTDKDVDLYAAKVKEYIRSLDPDHNFDFVQARCKIEFNEELREIVRDLCNRYEDKFSKQEFELISCGAVTPDKETKRRIVNFVKGLTYPRRAY